MNFNKHLELDGSHAFFSPSQPSWLRYDSEKVDYLYSTRYRTLLGTEIHEYAESQIILMQKVSSIVGLVKDISTFIFTKYKYLDKDKKVSEFSMTLVQSLTSLPPDVFETIKMFINDAIGFRMSPEVKLKYSDVHHGTADAMSFNEKTKTLKISDLKTGEGKPKIEQLFIYAALFCLEYKYKPADIYIELKIYQHGEIFEYHPSVDEIVPIIDVIISHNKVILKINSEEV